ncbi:HD domain-containing protein [Brachybacterium hainanense]|uniref:HD domain-containing protein n=1 Tax=Brachybacterium hainanense TaxID=1541174 RepID=A0ABV6RB73_9MICO
MQISVIAEPIARRAHIGQVDKTGHDYIEHPQRVADRAAIIAPAQLREEAVAAAWLHDVVEDTGVTLEDLAAAGMPPLVVEAVDRVTKRPGLPQPAYFAGIRAHPLALIVKTADLIDNTDPARVRLLDAATAQRLGAKYARSWTMLLGAAELPGAGAHGTGRA